MSDGPAISGGGSIAVDTASMVLAGRLLEAARGDIARVRSSLPAVAASASGATWSALAEAEVRLAEAERDAGDAADGLRIAAQRYGWAEHAAEELQRTAWAAGAAAVGTAARVLAMAFGPAGLIAAGGVVAEGAALALAARTLQRYAATGVVEPHLDPVVLEALGLTLSSLDDAARGFLLVERAEHLLEDDPDAFLGTETIATAAATLLLLPQGAPIGLHRSTPTTVARPSGLAELTERIPTTADEDDAARMRLERYDDVSGRRRWIVYIGGTVTFDRDSGTEPFDLASAVRGVGDRPSDSQRAVLQAMAEAGIGQDDPVLLVGHSQGALNAVRIAEDSGYTIGGVVQTGGPTGQIVLPESVPVLSVEHEQDLVPLLGGVAAGGSAGLERVVVSRSLPDTRATGPALAERFPAHDRAALTATLRAAEASGNDRVEAFRHRVGGFLTGPDGTATRVIATRLPAPARAGE